MNTTKEKQHISEETLLTGTLTDMAYQAIESGAIRRSSAVQARDNTGDEGTGQPSTTPGEQGCESTVSPEPGCGDPEPTP